MKNDQDYYARLNIARNASAEDIRKAYRKLARIYHPDVNKSAAAEEDFRRINEAYEVLKDAGRRQLYDTYGKDWQQAERYEADSIHASSQQKGKKRGRVYRFNNEGLFGEDRSYDDLFSNLFDGDFSRFSSRGKETGASSHTVETELHVSLQDIFQGGEKTVVLKLYNHDNPDLPTQERTLQVQIPKGMTDGSVLRLQDPEGFGILHIRLRVDPDTRFRPDGHDLHTTVALSPWEAALGTRLPVQTLDGEVSLTIPRHTQNGRTFRLRGKGLPNRAGKAGDLLVTVEIRIPSRLSPEEERLFTELAAQSAFNPRHSHSQHATRGA